MATIDDKLSSEEDLDNIDYDNQVDVNVDESSSSSLMKKILKIVKEVDKLNVRTRIWMILLKAFVKMNVFEENLYSKIINHRKTKRCIKIKIWWDKNNLNST